MQEIRKPCLANHLKKEFICVFLERKFDFKEANSDMITENAVWQTIRIGKASEKSDYSAFSY